MNPMKNSVVALMLLLTMTGLAEAGKEGRRDTRFCRAEVLHSEELPIAPPFYHTIKATMLVTASDARRFETTIYGVIPWQVPPPRQGQRVRVPCDPPALNSPFGFF
jgi:hypothetical protein